MWKCFEGLLIGTFCDTCRHAIPMSATYPESSLHQPRVISGVLGFTLTWNVIGNWAPTHRHHGDHREAGRIFSFLFVTCVSLLLLGLVLAYATQARSITGHLAHVAGPTRSFFAWIVNLLDPR